VRVLLLNQCTGGQAPRPFEEIAGIPGKRRTRHPITADGGGASFDATDCGSRSGQRSAGFGAPPPTEGRDDGQRGNRER
jgi:hypothetical protein